MYNGKIILPTSQTLILRNTPNNIMNKKYLLLLSCFLSSAHAMETTPIKQKQSSKSIPLELSALSFSPAITDKNLNRLILTSICTDKSLDQTRKTIFSLYTLNRLFQTTLGTSHEFLCMIKKISRSSDWSDQQAIGSLDFIKKMRKTLQRQTDFFYFCTQDIERSRDNIVRKCNYFIADGGDLEFTYSSSFQGKTTVFTHILTKINNELILGARSHPYSYKNIIDRKNHILEVLLEKNAYLHYEDEKTRSAYSLIFYSFPRLVPFLKKHKQLDPHKKNSAGITPLFLLQEGSRNSWQNINDILEAARILLEAGADPKTTYNVPGQQEIKPGMIVLSKNEPHPQLIALLEDAIQKKHATL